MPALVREQRRSTWHRDALTQASRAQLFTERLPDGRTRELSLLLFARAVAAADAVLRPDLPGNVSDSSVGRDPLLDSLSQFELLVTVVSGIGAGADDDRALLAVSYPNYASVDGGRANQIVHRLIFDSEVRRVLLAGAENHQLAVVLDLADHAAQQAGRAFWGWEGYTDPAVRTFINNHLHRG